MSGTRTWTALCLGGCLAAASVAPAGERRVNTWDWTGIIGTGQSLSVGAEGSPAKSLEQPFGNLKVSSGDLQWPVDANDPKLKLVPLVEPVGRRATGYPSSWPANIDGETPHTSAANEVSSLARQAFKQNYVTVHYAVGESGQGMIRIQKKSVHDGVTGRSYEAAMLQTKAITRLAKATGKSFGVGAIFMTHGETDTGNAKYEDQLHELWRDYNTDVKAITGQREDVLMIVSQHNCLGEYSASTLAQWKAGEDYAQAIVCSGPKYQYPYAGDDLHLNADGYRQLGEKYGQVYFERVVLKHKWRPLEPAKVTRNGAVLTIRFYVPVAPLAWDKTLRQPHASFPEWSNGKGFEIRDAAGARVTIQSADIRGRDTVALTCAKDPGPDARLSYAMVGEPTMRNARFGATPHWGLLRDSDPFIGSSTHVAQPNFCVAFAMTVP